MSRVTILDLVTDYEDADIGTCKKSRDIQVVPRTMVEMIIKRCEWAMNFYNQDTEYARGRRWSADDIRAYAEFLLMEFEEDEE